MIEDAFMSVAESAGLESVGSSWVRLLDHLEDGDSPADALRLAALLSSRIERALVLAVRQARVSGLTWRQIGDLLGVTPQAAHKRFFRRS